MTEIAADSAARAEILRQQGMLARQLRRAAFSFLALIFALGMLITAEIAACKDCGHSISFLASILLLPLG